MLIKDYKKIRVRRNLLGIKNLSNLKLISLIFFVSSLTFILSFILFSDKTKIKSKIPLPLKSRLKDSTLYKYYLSNFQVNVPKNILKSLFIKKEKIYIDIKLKDFELIRKKREIALKNKVLINNDNDYVNAKIGDSKKQYKADIRLKGDWTDHLIGNKWSFRVKLKKGKTFNGLNKFSLQSPKTRNFIWEWLYHEILRIEGLPALKYVFSPIVFNGNDLGIYAIEEHFDKILLESNEFKEGPIIKLSESLLWRQRKKIISDEIINKEPHLEITQSYIDVFKEKTILKNQNLYSSFLKASQLLNGFLEGKLKTSQVFDSKKLATFLAVSDLLNAHHGLIWHNQRFYFDPISEKLIPIGFDADAGKPLEKLALDNSITLNYFEDVAFMKIYVSELQRLSNKAYLDKLIKIIEPELNYQLSILHKSYPASDLNKKIISNNQKLINNKINPINPLNLFLDEFNDQNIKINVANIQSFPIEIIGLFQKNLKIAKPSKKYIVLGKKPKEFPKYKLIEFINNNKIKYDPSYPIEIHYKLYGNSNLIKSEVNSFRRLNTDNISLKLQNVSEFSFLVKDDNEKTVEFRSGSWIIDKPLITPKDYTLIIKNTSELEFNNNGFIYANGPIKFIGTRQNPLKIHGKSIGNGIAVINAGSTSYLKNVIFKNISNPQSYLWQIPGAITFYQSPVEIEDCLFDTNNSEDSLNIIRTNFKIKDTFFYNSKNDALDIDFSSGQINNLSIIKAGNDGLDISGSDIKVENIFLKEIGDKAISGGEVSTLDVKGLTILDAKIAIASKDKSNLKVTDINIYNADIGFAVFQKKEEYGSAKLEINNLIHNEIKTFYLLENKSFLKINNKNYKHNSYNLKSQLY